MDVDGVVQQVFAAVEQRDVDAVLRIFHPDVEFHWPPSLPYGGSTYGVVASLVRTPGWADTWDPFQPGVDDRKLHRRMIAASTDEATVLWRQRGRTRTGVTLDTPVLGLYQVRDGKLARAQMFYFDLPAVTDFLAASSETR